MTTNKDLMQDLGIYGKPPSPAPSPSNSASFIEPRAFLPDRSRTKDFKPVRQIISEHLETILELKIAEIVSNFGKNSSNIDEIKALSQAINPQIVTTPPISGVDDAERILDMAQKLKNMQGEPDEYIDTGDTETDLLQQLIPLLKPLIEAKIKGTSAPSISEPPKVIP